MELNPRQLDAFRKVMLTGSMTVAAERLQVSQPAVSRLIKDLEKTIGIRLFRREGNRLIPGAEAQVLFGRSTCSIEASNRSSVLRGISSQYALADFELHRSAPWPSMSCASASTSIRRRDQALRFHSTSGTHSVF